jgi:Tfp pilus assembly protein FimV
MSEYHPVPRLREAPQPSSAWRRSDPAPTPVAYRRRRLVAVVALATLAFVTGVLVTLGLTSREAGGSLTAAAQRARRPPEVTYVVQPGDSLWSIARALAGGDDPRPLVDHLAAQRVSAVLVPGEVVRWRPE